jgi:pyruvate dehydrogenase E2 component (dihydrolipoamide acetyltransferase)
MVDDSNVNVPDIGGATGVEVIEILVKPGDNISINSPLIVVESDKASMEIPSSSAGKIKQIMVNIGDKVAQGDSILTLVDSQYDEQKPAKIDHKVATVQEESTTKEWISNVTSSPINTLESIDVKIPDIGGAENVEVIDIMVTLGDEITKEQSLITLEGDKATMDIPAPIAGVVEHLALKIGDRVSKGSLILVIKSICNNNNDVSDLEKKSISTKTISKSERLSNVTLVDNQSLSAFLFAGPAVRRMARELGVDLTKVSGQGRKQRITKADIKAYVKKQLSTPSKPMQRTIGLALPTLPAIDFSQFGSIKSKPLTKVKRLTGINVYRSWLTIPQVTQFDEADITELDSFRKAQSISANQDGYKLTMLAFVTKIVSHALLMFPEFNTSLDETGEQLIYKHYVNIGIAVETPNGLVVPVIKNVPALSVTMIAQEMSHLSKKAREKSLTTADMTGGCFTISSLGGIGGTAFTPIVNGPEVAILGLSRSSMKPVFDGQDFKARLMLPLSLSYDHRVIDGAEAARFTRFIADMLYDIRRILL